MDSESGQRKTRPDRPIRQRNKKFIGSFFCLFSRSVIYCFLIAWKGLLRNSSTKSREKNKDLYRQISQENLRVHFATDHYYPGLLFPATVITSLGEFMFSRPSPPNIFTLPKRLLFTVLIHNQCRKTKQKRRKGKYVLLGFELLLRGDFYYRVGFTQKLLVESFKGVFI